MGLCIFINLIADIVHISLNARGGGERLAFVTIKALSSMRIDVELDTFEKPDFTLIRDAYGQSIEKDIKKIKTLNILQKKNFNRKYDIVVNTHGDMLPFFKHSFSKNNAITYCHYPIAGYLLDSNDSDYANLLQSLSLSNIVPAFHNSYRQAAKSAYKKMMLNSTVLTNSEFSRKAIFKAFGADSTILYPPVDVDTFRKAVLSSDARDDGAILVISRFHPSKKIENAIHLAKLLKQHQVGRHMDIVGNISPDGLGYYNYLYRLVKHYGLEDFVRFEVNVRFNRLLDLMRRARAYLHPMPGEPFGMSTVEAMSAGIIPVVPDIGGHTEFVPAKYQFHTFGQGVEAIAAALDAPTSERIMISNSTQKYSTANYVKKFQQIVAEILGISKPVESAQVISVSKRLPESMAA
jgi:alpha-1,2-mannosyltransferase